MKLIKGILSTDFRRLSLLRIIGEVQGGVFSIPVHFYIKIPDEFYTRISDVSLQFIFTLKSLINFIRGFQLFHNT